MITAILIIVITLGGTVLSVLSAWKVAAEGPTRPEADLSVATLVDRIAITYPGVEQIKQSPSGKITAFYFDGGQPGAEVIDPATGIGVGDYQRSGFARWMTNLHRSPFLDNAGRWVVAAGAASFLILSVSGLMLTARRVGGWRIKRAGPCC